jgi:hypothetical protein
MISKHTSKKRIAICEACQYFKPKSRTCGTPIIGDKVDGKKTCGCFMDVKTKLPFASCPFSFWKDYQVTEIDYLAMKELLHEVNHEITGGQKETLFELTNKYFGTNNKSTSCVPCLKNALKQMEQIISEYEQD